MSLFRKIVKISALYNLANVEGSTSHWDKARDLFLKAALYNPDLPWLGQV